jgi:4-hydroxy-tetrahydrodipicolinate reductase
MSIPLCLAGATGWAGSALDQALAKTADIRTISAVSRTHAQGNLGKVLCEPLLDCRIYVTAEEALAHPCDVFVEYTKPDINKSNVLAALRHEAHVVIGTSSLTDEDYADSLKPL